MPSRYHRLVQSTTWLQSNVYCWRISNGRYMMTLLHLSGKKDCDGRDDDCLLPCRVIGLGSSRAKELSRSWSDDSTCSDSREESDRFVCSGRPDSVRVASNSFSC